MAIIKEFKKGRLRWTFDSTADIIEQVKNHYPESYGFTQSKGEWNGGHSGDEIIGLLSEGWKGTQDIALKVKALADMSAAEENKATYERDLTGDFWDVGLYLAGEPEHCFSRRRVIKERQVFRIVVNISYNCNIGAETVRNRGAVITEMVEELRDTYDVELYMVRANSDTCTGKKHEHAGKLKGNDEVFIINMQEGFSRDQLAFYVGCPTFLRRVTFIIHENMMQRPHCDSYGRTEDWRQIHGKNDIPADIYFPPLNENEGYETIKAAYASMKRIMHAAIETKNAAAE